MRDWKKYTVWQLSHEFLLEIYRLTDSFPKQEVFILTGQLRRACLSIPTNIAEGAGRDSDQEFIKFLTIAQGSANEVEYLLLVANDLLYLNESWYIELDKKVNVIKKMLYKLIMSIRNK